MATSSVSQSGTRLSAQINHAGKPTNSEHQEMTLSSAVKCRRLTRLLKFLRVLSKCEVKIFFHCIKYGFVTYQVHWTMTKGLDCCHFPAIPGIPSTDTYHLINPLSCNATDVTPRTNLFTHDSAFRRHYRRNVSSPA